MNIIMFHKKYYFLFKVKYRYLINKNSHDTFCKIFIKLLNYYNQLEDIFYKKKIIFK